MGFLYLSAKFMNSLQFIYWSNILKNLVPQRSLLGQCQQHWFRARLESKQFFHSLPPLWSSEGQLTFLSLSFLKYKVGMIMGYRNVDITINNVRKCSVELYCTDSQRVVPGPAASTSFGNLLEMTIPGSHPRSAEPTILRWGSSNFCCNKPLKWFWWVLMTKKHFCSLV